MKYTGKNLKEISFPVGGIGTGSIGIAGNGSLIDWEIFNRPSKGSINGFSHIAIKAQYPDGKVNVRALNGDHIKDLMGKYSKITFGGFGYGPAKQTMAGFAHFKNVTFDGEFPIARLTFEDEDFPARVVMTVFNPFIPCDSFNSSIPAAFFSINVQNMADEKIRYSLMLSVANPFEESLNEDISDESYKMVKLYSANCDRESEKYGDITITCENIDADAQSFWYRGPWNDNVRTFWHDVETGERLLKREYKEPGKLDTGSIARHIILGAGENRDVRFLITWNVPNNYNYWSELKDENGNNVTWKNYYATVFEDSVKTARYCMQYWDSLYKRTDSFREALFDMTADRIIPETISATLSVLKTATVLRLEDGSFYGWEGMHEIEGSCEGTCMHVWNYAYALCFLFPDLEMSIRDLEFKYNTYDDGRTEFRMTLPLGREKRVFRPCVDGQMGMVIKCYREWKISGNDEWLEDNWNNIVKVMDFAWSECNFDEWDKDKDGVLEGRQHHTLDMELYGPSAWLEGFYMAALKAAAIMAEHLGYNDKKEEYLGIFDKAYKWTKENLFNGKYFIQKCDIKDKNILKHFKDDVDIYGNPITQPYNAMSYWDEEADEIKYQICDGCLIDQIIGQWHADICGLGNIFDPEQVKTALKSLYKNNYKSSMRNITNPWRIFTINDEAGTVMCDYSEADYKPVIPIPYCEETMHGFEYALAGLFLKNDMQKEALDVIKAVRDKYDGYKRNPWNELECGSNYARSMSSFAFIPILSGFMFDMSDKMIGFDPVTKEDDFRCIWSLEGGWGTFEKTKDKTVIRVKEGSLELNKVRLPYIENVEKLMIDSEKVPTAFEKGTISFDTKTINKELVILKSVN